MNYRATYKASATVTQGMDLSITIDFTYSSAYTKKQVMEQIKEIAVEEFSHGSKLFTTDDIKVKCVKTTDDRPVNPRDYPGMCAYIVELKDKKMFKVGMSCYFNRRKRELEKQYGTVNTIHLFKFDNIENAYLMEVLLHKYFKEKYPKATFIPNDRFKGIKCTEKDLKTLDTIAKELENKIWF